MDKKNGGPAFPLREQFTGIQHGGMTLRDYFAAKAMQGLISEAAWDYSKGHCNAELVKRAWIIADQMLEAREA